LAGISWRCHFFELTTLAETNGSEGLDPRIRESNRLSFSHTGEKRGER